MLEGETQPRFGPDFFGGVGVLEDGLDKALFRIVGMKLEEVNRTKTVMQQD